MSQGLFISTTTAGTGKSLVSLGVADSIYKRTGSLGYFRPISPDPQRDPMVHLMRENFDLSEEQARAGLSSAEVRELVATGEEDEIFARCVDIFEQISADVVVVEGTDFVEADSALELELNSRLALNLNIPVLAVVSGADLSPEGVSSAVELTRTTINESGAEPMAVIVNRANPDQLEAIESSLRPGKSQAKVYLVPELPELTLPSIAEIAQALNLEHISGSDQFQRDVSEVKAVSMEGGNFLSILNEGALVIVSGDRSDAILATMASALVPEFPVPSGMILTNSMLPRAEIQKMYANAPFPIFASFGDTFSTTTAVSRVRAELSSAQPRKIAAALGAWHERVDGDELLERLELTNSSAMTPVRFLHQLISRAVADRKRIVLPEGHDPRILRAAEILHRRNVCDLVILGDVDQIQELAATEGVDLHEITLIDPTESPDRQRYAEEYARLRAHKGVDLDRAREVMLDGAYFGTMMVHLDEVDGMVSGAANTTAHTIRPALEFIKTRPEVSIVSSVFFMLLPDRALVYGDCAVNPTPNAEQLADIAIASATTAEQFSVQPRVAMLSYSTGTSGSGEAVDKVREATDLVHAHAPHLKVDGPLQYDAAVSASVAASKMPDSDVAGQATVFIFPDLNTGNNTYKAVQQSSGAVAVGPVLQGLNKPVNDLSRGTTVEDIVNTVAITAVQAQARD